MIILSLETPYCGIPGEKLDVNSVLLGESEIF